jgi:hypothetical protein
MQSSQKQLNEITLAEVMPTKFGLELIADAIKEQVQDGVIDPLQVAIKMNALDQLSKMIKERIQENVMIGLGMYPKNVAEIQGAKVSMMDTIKYDYSHLPGWKELDDQIAILTEERKKIEDHEKTFFKGNLPVKSCTSTYKIILGK